MAERLDVIDKHLLGGLMNQATAQLFDLSEQVAIVTGGANGISRPRADSSPVRSKTAQHRLR
jgi:hypothetical protein